MLSSILQKLSEADRHRQLAKLIGGVTNTVLAPVPRSSIPQLLAQIYFYKLPEELAKPS